MRESRTPLSSLLASARLSLLARGVPSVSHPTQLGNFVQHRNPAANTRRWAKKVLGHRQFVRDRRKSYALRGGW